MAQPPPDDQFRAYLAAWLAMYVQAEQTLLGGISGILRFTPPTLLAQLLARMKMKALTDKVVRELTQGDRFYANPTILKAIEAGQYLGSSEVAKVARHLAIRPKPFDFSVPHGVRSAQAIRDDLVSSLDDVKRRITRLPDDVYKVISPAASAGQALGRGYTPAQAQAYAWRNYVKQGITGFTDRAGRNWSLSAYVEMSIRTATQRAYNDAHLQVMQAAGIHLFTVSDDGHPCPLCFPWQNRIISDQPGQGYPTIEEATAAGLFHPNCFPGFVPVSAPSGVSAADSRWYEGELVIIHTALGNELSVTPNHPVLTPEGWVAAGSLTVGQHVISYNADVERVDGMGPDDLQIPASIGDVYDALRHSVGVTTVRMPATAEQFHGDGFDAEVEVVLVDSLLHDGAETSISQGSSDRSLFVRGVRFSALLANGSLDEVGVGASHSTDSLVSTAGQFGTLCAAHARVALAGGSRHGDDDTAPLEPRTDSGLVSVEDGRDLALSLASEVTSDRIVKIGTREFAGHVYNLQTGDGWYVASSIVVHNCKHVLTAVILGITVLPKPREWTEEDAKNYALTQKQRRLELEIRKAKKSQEYAINADAQAAAKADVRQAQANLRAFIDQTGFLRQSRREQVDLANDHLKLPA